MAKCTAAMINAEPVGEMIIYIHDRHPGQLIKLSLAMKKADLC
jgi:hypothetical protein